MRFVIGIWVLVVLVWMVVLGSFQASVRPTGSREPESPTTTAAPATSTTTRLAPVTSTTRLAAISTTTTTTTASAPSPESYCRQAISRSVAPIVAGWIESCVPAPGRPRGGGWSIPETRTIYYDAEGITKVGQSWNDIPGMWDFFVAHERCHTDGPWLPVGAAADAVLAVERATDACAAGYGVNTRWSVYNV